MLDFGALPPEINSARMYSGPGSGPLMAAASAWDDLAAQLDSYAATYSSTVSELRGLWSGGASFAMAGAVAPYVSWATATATQAEQTAGQARAAAAAYEAAFAATVPPPVIAANRSQLAVLVATNFFGQNTPAIAATEAQYAEMWAQDAAAMYTYAAASSTASVLEPFDQPPVITDTTGQSAQAAAVSQAAALPSGQAQAALAELPGLGTGTSAGTAAGLPSPATAYSALLSAFSDFDTLVVGPAQPFWSTTYAVFSAGQFGTGSRLLGLQLAKATTAARSVGPEALRGTVQARVGSAAFVGKLSVPPDWSSASAAADRLNTSAIPLPDSMIQAEQAAVSGHPGTGMVGGMPRGNSEKAGSFVLRNGRRRFQMPRPPYGG
ncbi:PPE family protein [Mycobacterium bohemicum]|uniref:PPE family protein n=2 Tax=Mycobacterium bohemicum TaxID=56425 RepID=A0A1X1R6X9_MYCBE|nr:PPE family protein [Mycobacterium bohemicum]MCV6968035.1 PPE family protein [Mycobacterium bohemicum]ORV00627.1 hypothetical protein AWB93_08845 [Mycobacterium bohemicum]